MLQLISEILFGVFRFMHFKICAIGAMVYGLKSLSHPRSIKSGTKSDTTGQSVTKQVKYDANGILANYGRALLVESNLK